MTTYPNDTVVPAMGDGLTKRELFAAVALHGILVNRELQVCIIEDYIRNNMNNPEATSPLGDAAVGMADELIHSLNKEQSNA
jgi:hypothetical protein